MARVATRLLIDTYESGRSLKAIAKEWRIAPTTVKARLLRAGVTLRRPGRPSGRAIVEAVTEMAAMRADAVAANLPPLHIQAVDISHEYCPHGLRVDIDCSDCPASPQKEA